MGSVASFKLVIWEKAVWLTKNKTNCKKIRRQKRRFFFGKKLNNLKIKFITG
jgi:hypothetical protein